LKEDIKGAMVSFWALNPSCWLRLKNTKFTSTGCWLFKLSSLKNSLFQCRIVILKEIGKDSILKLEIYILFSTWPKINIKKDYSNETYISRFYIYPIGFQEKILKGPSIWVFHTWGVTLKEPSFVLHVYVNKAKH
jgi:hypothetical protein